jgi:hypothetical protein
MTSINKFLFFVFVSVAIVVHISYYLQLHAAAAVLLVYRSGRLKHNIYIYIYQNMHYGILSCLFADAATIASVGQT